MSISENDYQILKLTELFYQTYPNISFREILQKRQRAYNCLLFQSHYDYYICIPYRSEIHHEYAFLFSNTKRSRKHKSGLDYTKIVIVGNNEYIDSKNAIIDKDEFNETIKNFERIKREALNYVEDYVSHIDGTKKMHPREFERRYNYSTLQYFYEELGLKKKDK